MTGLHLTNFLYLLLSYLIGIFNSDISFLYDASRAVSLERVRASAREAFERRVLDKFDASADRKAERDRPAGAPSPKKEVFNRTGAFSPYEVSR